MSFFLITFILSFFNIIDNNMINGTKLLNAAGMSRGKRDGILKNERGRMVVKIGAMHLKGVW
jgi:protein SOK2